MVLSVIWYVDVIMGDRGFYREWRRWNKHGGSLGVMYTIFVIMGEEEGYF